MKITMYELLGLMLKRQAPKKIEVLGFTMNYVKNAHWGDYEDEETHIRLSSFRLNECLNDEVEIIEEKKIPEKLSTWFSVENVQNNGVDKTEFIIKYANHNFETYFNKINEIIDYLKSKGE